MGSDVYKKAVECLPMFFNSQLQFDFHGSSIFEPLKNIIDFDEAYIFFLNPDSIRLRYLFSNNRKFNIGDIFYIDSDLKTKLFTFTNVILDENNKLISLLEIENNKSFLTSKLIIKETVYGFVLLCKKEENYYNEQDLKIATAIGSVISYNIKDIELSDIFNIQLKALKESILQTKSAYKTIEEQNIKILEADKVKNDFLANISHELRTPLNAIIGFSEILANQFFGPLNEKQAEYVTDIHISGIHLLGMINELLDISKIEAKAMTLNRTEFLTTLVSDEVTNIVRPLADKKLITIKKDIKEFNIYADFQKIKQILYNLLSNAIKFTPEKGEIDINIYSNKENLFIEVKDNGRGIAINDQKKIFEKFVQLENTYTKRESSTGLGLTITKELVEMHSGEISVQSDIGKGAAFIIKMPVVIS